MWQWLGVCAAVSACGVSVHLSLIDRMIPKLPPHIAQHADYLRAGAFFPDAFYGCMGQSEAAEDAHWPPFLRVGAGLVSERRNLGQKTTELEAFLIGVLSHQVADVSWHSLGLHQGLLRAIADREFDGDYDAAHSVLDVGGDMIQVHRLQSGGASEDDWLAWSYDTQDISTMLARMGYLVTGSQITYCMSRGRAALAAEHQVATPGYRRYARQSPLLFDELEDYPVGGMTDMYDQISECTPRLLKWFDQRPNDNEWDICQVFQGRKPRPRTSNGNHINEPRLVHEPHSLVSVQGLVSVLRDGIMTMISKSNPLPEISHGYNLISDTMWARFGTGITAWGDRWAFSAPGEGIIQVYNTDMNINTTLLGPLKLPGMFHPQFGKAMAVYLSRSTRWTSSEKYLIVAIPGLSKLNIYSPKGDNCGTISWAGTESAYGKTGSKFIGESLAVDTTVGTLYVGAPRFDGKNGDQVGAVFAVPSSIIELVISEYQIQDLPYEVILDDDPIIVGTKPYGRLGTQLATTSQFVLVGAPGESSVYGLDRLTHHTLLKLEDEQGSGFGGYLLEGNQQYIIIGAPLHDTKTQSGKIYVYKNTQRREIAISGGFGTRLGHSGAFDGDTYVYTASPHANDEQGALWRLNVHTSVLESFGGGPSPYAGAFGDSVGVNEDQVVVGIPHYRNRGAVAVVNISQTLPQSLAV